MNNTFAEQLLDEYSPERFVLMLDDCSTLSVDDLAVVVPAISQRISSDERNAEQWFRIAWYLAWLGREVAEDRRRKESMEQRAYYTLAHFLAILEANDPRVKQGAQVVERWALDAATDMSPSQFSPSSTAEMIRTEQLERVRAGRRVKSRLAVLRQLPETVLSPKGRAWLDIWDMLP